MQSPIILIGTHRSGTTWMASILAQHPSLAYWSEPKYVWSWGNNYKADDVLTLEDLSPRIDRHIKKRFQGFLETQEKDRLLEKTPSNCLRLKFIQAIFPSAKILHIIRDGRSVFKSTDAIRRSGFFRQDVLSRRLHEMLAETPVYEWPAYVPQASQILISKIRRKPLPFWGPRPPGWRNWLKHDSSSVVLAKQWVGTIERAVSDSLCIPSENYFRFYYEDLIADPEKWLSQIFEFTCLSKEKRIFELAKTTSSSYVHTNWHEILLPDLLSEVQPILEPTLRNLGYEW